MAKKKFYAVKVGKTPGIYESWAECEANVKGFPKAEYKGFPTLDEAESYMLGNSNVGNVDSEPLSDADNGVRLTGHDLSKYYIGQDEVGRAEPFRRVIVVAAYIDGEHDEELKSIGAFNDSKNYGIGTERSVRLGSLLTHFTEFGQCKNGVYENEKLGITYSIYSIGNGDYNELHSRDGFNGNRILTIMHNRAGYNLCTYLSKSGITIKDVVIDNFIGAVNAVSNYAKYTADEKYRLDVSGVTMHYETKSESRFGAVAVAANIASYIESLYESQVRESIRDKGGDFDQHGFSNAIDDVQYAFDELVKVYGAIDNSEIAEEFKYTAYYYNYVKTGVVTGGNS